MIKYLTILLLYICFLPKMLCAQDSTLRWLQLSAGLGGAGVAAGANFHWAPAGKKIYYGVHSFFSDELFYEKSANTLGPVIGVFGGGRYGFVGLNAGLGPVWGAKNGDLIHSGFLWDVYERVPYVTIGVPIQAEFRFDPLRFAGLGFVISGNINPEMPYGSMMLSLSLGKLKPRRHPKTTASQDFKL